jgi:hypothetical protein
VENFTTEYSLQTGAHGNYALRMANRAHPKIADDERNAESGSRCTFSVTAMHFPQRIVSAASRMLTGSPTRKRLPNMNTAAFEDRPPDSAELTPYDERHLATYLRLLDAYEEGADWKEAVKIIFGLDPDREPQRARLVYDSHLARARWMTQSGYRHLLHPRSH